MKTVHFHADIVSRKLPQQVLNVRAARFSLELYSSTLYRDLDSIRNSALVVDMRTMDLLTNEHTRYLYEQGLKSGLVSHAAAIVAMPIAALVGEVTVL